MLHFVLESASELLPENDAAGETFLEKQEPTSQDSPEAVVAAERDKAEKLVALIANLEESLKNLG